MSGPGDIKAGGAYVELYADDSRLSRDLEKIGYKLSGLVGVTRMAFSSVGVYMAAVNMESARMSGTITEAYQAELKMNDAVGDMIGQIPLIGHAVRSAFDAFGDRAAIEQAIKNIGEIETAIKTMETKARQWAQETAIRRAQLAGDQAGELAARAGGAAFERGTSIEDARRHFALIQQERARAEQKLIEFKAMDEEMTNRAKTNDPARDLFGLAALGYRDKALWQMNIVADLTAKEQTALALLKTMIQQSNQAAEVASASIDAARTEARKKAAENVEKNLGEAVGAAGRMQQYTTTDEFERRRNAEREHYYDMLDLAKKYGGDREAIEKAFQANMAKIGDDERKAQDKKARDLASARVEQEDALATPGAEYARRAERKVMDALIQKDPEEAKRVLTTQIAQAKATALALAAEARMKLQEALADNVYTDTERADVQNATRNATTAAEDYLRKQEEMDTLMNKPGSLLQGADVTQTFSAVAAFGMGLGTNAGERTASASESTAKNTKRVADAAEKGLAFVQ